jgi:hypothetical protein
MKSLYGDSGLTYEQFKDFLTWVCTEHKWTAENLRLARDPMSSLAKQFEKCMKYYTARKAGKTAAAAASGKAQVKEVGTGSNSDFLEDAREAIDYARSWSKDVGEIPAKKIRRAILYHAYFAPDDWFRSRMSDQFIIDKCDDFCGRVPFAWELPTVGVGDPDCTRCRGSNQIMKHVEDYYVIYPCACERKAIQIPKVTRLLIDFNNIGELRGDAQEAKRTLYKKISKFFL